MFRKMSGAILTVCDWIMKLAYVNLLWFLFTIVGLIVFGFMPATVALFTIVRKWLMKEIDIPIWRTFLMVYKQEFRKANALGLLLAIGAFLIFVDFQFSLHIAGGIRFAMVVLLLIMTCFYLILLLYIFPVYVHYDLQIFGYLKNAFFLGVLHLHMVFLMLIGVLSVIYLLFYLPGCIPFFSVVVIAYITMSIGMYSFNHTHRRQVTEID